MRYCPTPDKKSYVNKGVALRAVTRIRKNSRTRHNKKRYIPVEPYACTCGEYHLCTADKAKFKRK